MVPVKKISINGMDGLSLQHSSGSCVELTLYGAHIVSWKNKRGEDLLMLSKKSLFEKGKPIRGGIPLVFPQFSDEGLLPKHGFARTSCWKLEKTGEDSSGSVFALLSLESNSEIRTLWQYDFKVKYLIVLGDSLKLTFSVFNESSSPFSFQMAFHTYFSVPRIEQARVEGLKGIPFVDYLANRNEFQEKQDALKIGGETDRVYRNVTNDIQLVRVAPDNRITVKKYNMPDVVIWNPWKKKAHTLQDFGDDEYLSMLCIETGIVYKPHSLAPAERWEGTTEYLPSC
jgi:glucose-6-phosphate 1-epimerase